ncbi:MAG: hypothetical protein ACLRMZ_24235 [Blautia marasmi]
MQGDPGEMKPDAIVSRMTVWRLEPIKFCRRKGFASEDISVVGFGGYDGAVF